MKYVRYKPRAGQIHKRKALTDNRQRHIDITLCEKTQHLYNNRSEKLRFVLSEILIFKNDGFR